MGQARGIGSQMSQETRKAIITAVADGGWSLHVRDER